MAMIRGLERPPETGGAGEAGASVAAAALFRALGDPSRLAIVQHLLLGEHNVAELTAHLGLAQSTVSKHLACLRDCGLVASRPVGRASVFEVTEPDRLVSLLAAVEALLAATGDAAASCATSRRRGDR
jgi:DNA-binding transcriptional ArsR family regulator